MSQYTIGRVSVTNNNNSVVGVGTVWTSNVAVGDLFNISGAVVIYQVSGIVDDTHLTLSAPYGGPSASNQPYAITRDFTPNKDLPLINPGDLNSAALVNRAMHILDSEVVDTTQFATATQGAKADSAVQPDDLGSAAFHPASDFATATQGAKADAALPASAASGFATATQGAKADSAVQPEDLGSAAYQASSAFAAASHSQAAATISDFADATKAVIGDGAIVGDGATTVSYNSITKVTTISSTGGSSTVMAAPTLGGGSSAPVGGTYILTMSAVPGLVGTSVASFEVTLPDATTQVVAATSNAASYVWTVSGTSGQTKAFAVVATDSLGNISQAASSTITLVTVAVNQATITAPTNGTTEVGSGLTVTTAAFAVTGGTDTHLNTDWEIRTATSGAGTLIWSSLADATNKTSITVPSGTLSPATTYYVRARHRGTTYGAGAWGENSFSTAAAFEKIIGIALVTTGGGAGTWQRVDKDGNDLTGSAYNLGGSYYSSHSVFSGMVDATIDGQAMVKVPAFYYKVGTAPVGSSQAGKVCWWISDLPSSGFVLHPAFMNAGSTVSQFWVGKYQGGDDASTKVKSTSGVAPLVNIALSTYQTRCAARNTGGVTGFMLWSIYQLAAIQMLALIESGGSDSQTLIGVGRVNQSSIATVDASDVAQATYRGIVGLWGNAGQFCDGIKTVSGAFNLWDRSGNKTWVSTGISRQFVNPGYYPVTMLTSSGTGYDFKDVFIGDTGAAIGSSTWPDSSYLFNTGDYVPFVGGTYNAGSSGGLWYINFYNGAADGAIVGRLAKY